ncbi:MAG: peptidoglycan-binding protein [Catenulisporales bacterium]|nr:peptidoglycan-binding protein [Catenulisporales bacterium]
MAEYEGVRRPAPRQASPNTAGRRQPEAGLPVPQPRPTARPMAQPQPNQYPSAGRSAMRDVPWSGARQIAELREADREAAGGTTHRPDTDPTSSDRRGLQPGFDPWAARQPVAADRGMPQPRQRVPGVDPRFGGRPSAADRATTELRQQTSDVDPRAVAPLPSADRPTSIISRQVEPRRPAAAPRRVQPEWLIPGADLRIPDRQPAPARLSDRAVGYEVVRRPDNEFAARSAGGGDLPPSLRGATGGRHRGPRRPAMFRAAVPVAAVLAAGGGALGLVHATGTGTPDSQAMDSSSRSVDSAVTTNLANAPSGLDGDASGPTTGADPASSGFDDSTPGTVAHTTGGEAGAKPGAPAGKTSTPGSGGPVGAVTSSRTPGAPVVATTSPVANGPVQISTPPPGTPAASVPSAPSTPPPATPPATPGDPSTTPTSPGTPPGTPSTPGTPPSDSTPGSPGSSSTPSTPTSAPTSTPTSTTPPAPTTTPNPTPTGTTGGNSPGDSASPRVLQSGDTGQDVSDLQTRLDRLSTPTWVPVTGVYDTRTADAVAYVQNQLNITDDPRGVCGLTTAAAIATLASR